MSSPPPTKPPRGVKQGKETSGLLMSVIRTLSASETNEQREKERAKLEKEYKKSDARLDELVAAHAQEIMEVMQKFTAVSQSLTSWGQHCDAASARLTACRSLLRLRRDDLKRLWMTARTHHYALQMLTDIERVVVSERQARELISAGRVVGAAHTLASALSAAPVHVTALSATTVQLQIMKQNLVETVVKNMSIAVYRGERTPRTISSRRRAALLLAELTKSEEVTDAYLQEITPEFEASLTEEDKTFETTIMISLEALGVLEQLQEATEKFKVNIQNELLEVIDIVSRRVIEEGDVEPEREQDSDIGQVEGVNDTGRPLARLVTILVDEFRAIAARNKRLLQLWRAALQKYKLSDLCLHTEQHYWSAVQQVMQLLVTEYLDIESVQAAGLRAGSVAANYTDTLRLSDYFAKKRPARRRTQLFKLEAPPVRSLTTVRAVRGARAARVCQPHPAHLPHLLPPLHDLCTHIELISCVSECSLRAFVTDYVRSGESERLARAARANVEAALRAPDAWRERAQPPPDNTPGWHHRVIFSCCIAGWASIEAATLGARACGALSGAAALRGALAGAAALAAGAGSAHARRAALGGRAGKWLADDDIVRFLQALPNWRAAINAADKPGAQELQAAYEREAEILGSSLGDGAIARTEIIANTDTLIDLAVHCESMDWIASKIRSIPAIVSGGPAPGGGLKLNDKLLNDINSAAVIFDDISHKCLLLLHLEMRISCFHYLGCVSETEEAEGGAGQLCAALIAFHERAAAILAPHRLQYVIHGIGEMMSAGVVWGWRAGGVGVGAGPRLAPLRHCLAALRAPATGLRHAHRYLDLLDMDPQEIITQVREKGAQFTELEYLNAFKIIGAKRGISQSDMKQYLKQLSAALGHVGVTV